MSTSWPSMRLFTTTVLNASTEPRPLRYTGRSRVSALATATGMVIDIPPRPPGPFLPPAACGFCELQPAKPNAKAHSPVQPASLYHERLSIFILCSLLGEDLANLTLCGFRLLRNRKFRISNSGRTLSHPRLSTLSEHPQVLFDGRMIILRASFCK